MDALIGLLVLVAVIWVVRLALAGGTSAGGDRPTSGGTSSPPPGSNRPRFPTVPDPAERRRRDAADEAFIDGVLFAHYFDPLDRYGLDDDVIEDEAYWGDDDGFDDGSDDAFHDDAGDW